MSPPRSASRYPPPRPCPLERYLDVVSGAWVPRILWYLLDRPHRFGELRRSISGVSAKVLTSKLRALERQDLVVRRVIPASPPQVTYSLTDRGHALEPVFRAMEKAARRLFPEPRPSLKASGPTISRSKARTRSSDERMMSRAEDKGPATDRRKARKSRSVGSAR